jgi:hypothetical protein
MDRRAFIVIVGASILPVPLAAEAQQTGKVYRIGFQGPGSGPPVPFLTGLRDFGYVEGQNILIEYRWAQGKYSSCFSWSSPNIRSDSTSEKPMIAFSGVRSSWDMFARNSDLCWLATSSSRLLSSISRKSRAFWMARAD